MNQPNDVANVLIVDDEQHARSIASLWLTAEGYNCAEADGADSAWAYLQEHDIQLVTLDVRMPKRSGLDVLSDIVKTYPDTAVIMLTATGQTQTAIDSMMRGACSYLLKPFIREEFLFHVRRALERRQLILDKRQYTAHLEDEAKKRSTAIRSIQEHIFRGLLSVLSCRDGGLATRFQRVASSSELLAKAAGWSAEDVERLRMAAPMYDVGKLGIPDAILLKPGRLTPDEFRVMKTHTTIGAQILSSDDSPVLTMAREIAHNHHERWDGDGYPRGLARDAIPECARIVAIAEVYDAATHGRVYRPAIPEEKALDILRDGAGTQFDPMLLTLFFAHISEIRRLADQYPDAPVAAIPATTPRSTHDGIEREESRGCFGDSLAAVSESLAECESQSCSRRGA